MEDDVALDALPLKERTRTSLLRAGFKTAGDVRQAPVLDLLRVEGLTMTNYNDIVAVIGHAGVAQSIEGRGIAAKDGDTVDLDADLRRMLRPVARRGFASVALTTRLMRMITRLRGRRLR